uniref:ER membrane protein complex subunit 10 n=1 Tax=Rhabditophanes sp. KR3021 TaxID=114890 RepID=A0AC35TTC8_9BILA
MIKLSLFLSLIWCVFAVPKDVSVSYSISDTEHFKPLGVIKFKSSPNREADIGTKFDVSANTLTSLKRDIQTGIQSNADLYYLSFDDSTFITSLPLCLISDSNLAHKIDIVIGKDENNIASITLHPYSLVEASINGTCVDSHGVSKDFKNEAEFVIEVVRPNQIPPPDTLTFLTRIEKEQKARQAGGDADNRGFFQKYWVYIAVALVMLVVSNAMAPQEG